MPLVVSIPAVGGPPSGATGQFFNATASDLMIPGPGGTSVKSMFVFDTLDGTIQGWNPGSRNYLYAADATGQIRVFDGAFNDVTGTTFAGKFVDPSPVPGFNPYGPESWREPVRHLRWRGKGRAAPGMIR